MGVGEVAEAATTASAVDVQHKLGCWATATPDTEACSLPVMLGGRRMRREETATSPRVLLLWRHAAGGDLPSEDGAPRDLHGRSQQQVKYCSGCSASITDSAV